MAGLSDVVKLTRSLVSIPSFVDDNCNEIQLAEFLTSQLSELGFPIVEHWPVNGERYNVVAFTEGAKDNCSLILAGHMDTVSEKNGWKTNPYKGAIKGDRLYGLGSADMKGGIAALICALRKAPMLPEGLCVLFYCDEEYDFVGMRSFLKTWVSPSPEMCLIAEPTDLQILGECRGVIEVLVRTLGKTGHSSRPNEGNNAIIGLAEVLLSLRSWLRTFDEDPLLGLPTFNVAKMRGGVLKPDAVLASKESISDFAPGSNNIADYAQALIEVRPTEDQLDGESVKRQIADGLSRANLELIEVTSNLDVGVLRTPRAALSGIEAIVSRHLGTASFQDARRTGYTDGQLLRRHFLERDRVSVPVACFGPVGSNWHGPNEWVSLSSLSRLVDIYADLIHSVRTDA